MNEKKSKDVAVSDEHPETNKGFLKQFREDEVSASVFGREYQGRMFYNVVPQRAYKARDGKTKYTHGFDENEVNKLLKVLQSAKEYMHGLRHPERSPED